jgi:hypothetical protein
MRVVVTGFMTWLLLTAALLSPAAAEFRLEDYFQGRTVARGEFAAINGVRRGFDVELFGLWNGRRLKLVEDFAFDDGTRDRKTWIFTRTGKNTYVGTREDVRGQTTVTVRGNVARFAYDLYLEPETKGNLVRFSDTMELRKDGTVLNTAWVSKFGLPVARTRVEFRRP